jgi:cytidylate kinase
MEGRDIGTIVFPDAELKIFLTAEAEIRAKRRLNQLKEKFSALSHSYEKILEEIQSRDSSDTNRTVAPLRQAKDAIFIDTSHLSVDQVVEEIIGLTKKIKYKT